MRAFWIGVLAVLGLLLCLGVASLRAAREARVQAALRRVDRRFADLLAQEAERPPEQYRAFLGQEEAYTKMFQKIRAEEVQTPSPLVASRPPWIRIHFELDPEGSCTSPQVPTGTAYELLVPAQVAAETVSADAALLERVKDLARGIDAEPILRPCWRGGELLCVREAGGTVQGFLADWPRLRAILLEEVDIPGARLGPGFTLEAPIGPGPWSAAHAVFVAALGAVLLAGVTLRKSILKQRRFASLVTHELRSPLTTFRLHADLLAEGLVTDPAKTREYHRTLQRESDQMARMVENVIAHSRLEEGRAQLRREPATLASLIERIAPDLARCAEKAGVDLAIDEAADAALDVDAEAFGQIVFNLVDNACKYGAGSPVRVSSSARDGAARIAVRDRGPGIPRGAARRRLFTPFERGRRDEALPVRGLGLGLALARGLARDLGGDLAYEEPPDGGACFVLSLPVSSAA